MRVNVGFVLCLAIFFTFDVSRAETKKDETIKHNVTVNGIDIFNVVSMSEWLKAFGADGKTIEIYEAECSVDGYVIKVRYPHRDITLLLSSDDNPNIKERGIFRKKATGRYGNEYYINDSYKSMPLVVWIIEYDFIARSRDVVVIDGKTVKLDMSLKEFKETFAYSVKSDEDDSLYYILANPGFDERYTIYFYFKDDRLFKISTDIWAPC
ncbi:MAG: hypothetical protein LBQ52_09450 [Helicobacteraceae bacterium]|jgi:hypothetical protein|nr:hypothetical protein [Helicobacteraceae bacterium]